ncbi:hypothetical protein [Paenibacillus radicis (ex Xue et al. 2023)]|uniref:Uncharacterized protein n=1 Tax=Paenibacillus radicis (ex Xue et al. 2023) TaxID=2972489 RepID=A0ABT1YBJ6_9BACL|nr:hypothetical protein [Paenibacillus radicis (ex Xue et al. 2023)]MCR8630564.1 hypothetical protein [Paenibacillus radicis (ex Xue et al. 2023)]
MDSVILGPGAYRTLLVELSELAYIARGAMFYLLLEKENVLTNIAKLQDMPIETSTALIKISKEIE